MADPKPKIFLSYAYADRENATHWAEMLRDMGMDVSTDTEVKAGDNFVEQIQDSIEQCSGVISFVSNDFEASKWAQAETAFALDSKKPVLPVLVEDCAPEGPLSFYQMLDARDEPHSDAHVQEALKVIERWAT